MAAAKAVYHANGVYTHICLIFLPVFGITITGQPATQATHGIVVCRGQKTVK